MEQLMFLSLLLGSFFNRRNGLIVALILGALCLVLIVSFMAYYFLRRKDEIKDVIKESIYLKGSIYQAIKNLVLEDEGIIRRFSNRRNSDNALTKSEIERIVQQKVDKAMENIQNKQYDEFVQPVSDETKPVEEVSKSNSSFLYASCVDAKKRSFYTVTKLPDKDTIFVLELNPEDENEATFTVYDKVFKKVIGEQGYLRDGCTIENPGMNSTTIVRTIEPGLTFCKNGEWVVKEQAKVKFE